MSEPGSEPPWLLQWVVNAAVVLLVGVVAFLFRRIDATRADADAAAIRVRNELTGTRQEDRDDIAARHAENRAALNRLEAMIVRENAETRATVLRAEQTSMVQHNRMDERLTGLLAQVADRPTREEVERAVALIRKGGT